MARKTTPRKRSPMKTPVKKAGIRRSMKSAVTSRRRKK